MFIDLNCDLGEGVGTDGELLPLITSANVCCGAHAGDAAGILATLKLAAKHGVSIGAHPGHPDRENFGRRELQTPPRTVLEETIQQIASLREIANKLGQKLRYVKPHGGLYHQACRDDAYADAIVSACVWHELPVIGLPGSRLEHRATGRVPFFAEGFADRGYRTDGSLISRDEPGAFIESPHEAAQQVLKLISERGVRTICVHGDNPQAVEFVRAIREELLRGGAELRAFA